MSDGSREGGGDGMNAMTDIEHFNFLLDVLETLAKADLFSGITWHAQDRRVAFYVNCNDVFCWATSESEEITLENLPVLKQAIIDAAATLDVGACYADALFASRVRGQRPQRPWLERCPPEVWPLFFAAGPERSPKDEG